MRLLAVILLTVFGSCQSIEDDHNGLPNLELFEVPNGFPAIEHPDDNLQDPNRWTLGKKLFFDPILSKSGKVSCASCHQQALAFTDGLPVSIGDNLTMGRRNAPSLANVAYHPYFTREGGVPTLEMQVLVPIQEHDEFNNNIVLIADTLQKIPEYVQMAQLAYQRDPDPYVITRALAQYERSLISGQSNYDQEIHYDQKGSMSASAMRGMSLFMSDRLDCSSCHSGINFTNYQFENNGLYSEYDDPGRARFTQKDDDVAKFKVPSLRNVAVTAPYMHDGSVGTLESVIDHYDKGGVDHRNKSHKIKPLYLSNQEKEDLKSFLESLTDTRFIQNKIFQP